MVHISNLYDTYFEGGRDHKLDRPSITHVPYYDGEAASVCEQPVWCGGGWVGGSDHKLDRPSITHVPYSDSEQRARLCVRVWGVGGVF